MPMFSDPYIEALLVDEDLADQVWELWNARLVSDELAAGAWWLLGCDPGLIGNPIIAL